MLVSVLRLHIPCFGLWEVQILTEVSSGDYCFLSVEEPWGQARSSPSRVRSPDACSELPHPFLFVPRWAPGRLQEWG